ncbi:NXPE4-like protein [Mya arenaria]|uniref:NXPE4-like protein n=1 Tax=Mya arenaria TaxID=6604 RepID=A0ABY7DMG0_MYAAR|nr:NXPE4-like protein [Mya arenaria]
MLVNNGSHTVKVGDTVTFTVVLCDRQGKRRQRGGDLVRVWLTEPAVGAAVNARVLDNGDGSYTAATTVFWVGRPEIKAAIISPREVIAAVLNRRHICPPVLVNTAIFQHPVDKSIKEETPCNAYPHVTGYDVICNLTEDNFGWHWYCGKPRHDQLQCVDWTAVADRNLWSLGTDINFQSDNRKALCSFHVIATPPCSRSILSHTWKMDSPTGHLYKNTWFSKNCRPWITKHEIRECLRNTNIALIGDSTLRQMFYSIRTLISCKWGSDTFANGGKHRTTSCNDITTNTSLAWIPHGLPFCTGELPRQYLKTFKASVNILRKTDQRNIIVFHIYAHTLNYHSRVFYSILKDLASVIRRIIADNDNTFVVLKGPHAFSFAKSKDHVIWMPDVYASIYTNFINDEFDDIKDRVMFLEALDMTIATEQWHIHSEKNIILQHVLQILEHVC